MAALLAAIAIWSSAPPVWADGPPATPAPFETIPLPANQRHGHLLAYSSLLVGAGLIGGSFVLSAQANDKYDEYLAETDPEQIDRLYDETVRLDKLSSGALISGEVLVALGLYLRFLRHPAESRVQVSVSPARCSLGVRF
jgi:hypothetical protein